MIPAGTIAKISDIPLKEVISSLGGWPVREPPGWDPGAAPRLEWVLGTLKRNFTLGALVEEWIGPDDRDSSRHIIQVDMAVTGHLRLGHLRLGHLRLGDLRHGHMQLGHMRNRQLRL